MTKRPRKSRPAAPPVPVNSGDGASAILAGAVPLFDRKDGTGADWALLAESLFRAGFSVLDELEPDLRRRMAERVHAAAYERFLSSSAGEDGTGDAHAPEAKPQPAQQAFNPKPSLRP